MGTHWILAMLVLLAVHSHAQLIDDFGTPGTTNALGLDRESYQSQIQAGVMSIETVRIG
jgi:hypothetical protein